MSADVFDFAKKLVRTQAASVLAGDNMGVTRLKIHRAELLHKASLLRRQIDQCREALGACLAEANEISPLAEWER